MADESFTVDTHLFRELGALLVGRDSTALVELIKNSYDADATEVLVHGESLGDPATGVITVSDNGTGMTQGEFREGFLRIASRLKEDSRVSALFKRRYTGAKGVGRLAAHKLAAQLDVTSVSHKASNAPIKACIDWDEIEKLKTLSEIGKSGAVTLVEETRTSDQKKGTSITLRRLRKEWTPVERARFLAEVQTFRAPRLLLEPPTKDLASDSLLGKIAQRDVGGKDPGFSVVLSGDFDGGEEYWKSLAEVAGWVIEIDALKKDITFALIPSATTKERFPHARKKMYSQPHPNPKEGPFFQARILVREGKKGSTDARAWLGRMSGIRVYMEGFRVLPYGEPNNDWLMLDADYSHRSKTLGFMDNLPGRAPDDENEALSMLRNESYFGGVFLTLERAVGLKMLVNREGFIPDASYDALVEILRTAVYLSVRVRAGVSRESREERSEKRRAGRETEDEPSRRDLRERVEAAVTRASGLAAEARALAATGDMASAKEKIDAAGREFALGSETSERLMTEGSMLRVLASVGTQMAAFVHEINSLLGAAQSIEVALKRIREGKGISQEVRRLLAELHSAVGDLRRAVERQASYLTDVTSPDARRRRSRQRLADRFRAASRLFQATAERRSIKIEQSIPEDLKSPPMFPAEMTLVFSNLLSNAVKNAGEGGRIQATAKTDAGDAVVVRVENTGIAVDLEEGERWFRPFESTTTKTDPLLGQGMGMGLPITRNILEEYGATIRFARPSKGFATAVEIRIRG